MYVWNNATIHPSLAPIRPSTSHYDFPERCTGWVKSNGTCLSY